jgi:hypothetical protein
MEIPPVSMSAPARIKKGIARRGKESDPVKIFWETMTRGISPFSKSPKTDARPMLKAMGTLTAMRQIKVRLRKRPIRIVTPQRFRGSSPPHPFLRPRREKKGVKG